MNQMELNEALIKCMGENPPDFITAEQLLAYDRNPEGKELSIRLFCK